MLDHDYAYQLWTAVIFNAGLFIFFVFSFLKPKGKWEWRFSPAYKSETVKF